MNKVKNIRLQAITKTKLEINDVGKENFNSYFYFLRLNFVIV